MKYYRIKDHWPVYIHIEGNNYQDLTTISMITEHDSRDVKQISLNSAIKQVNEKKKKHSSYDDYPACRKFAMKFLQKDLFYQELLNED